MPDISFSDDFDGTGTGQWYRASSFQDSSFSQFDDSGGGIDISGFVEAYRQKRQEQAQEAKERAEKQRRIDMERQRCEERLREARRQALLTEVREIEFKLTKLQIDESNEPDIRKQMVLKQKVYSLEKQFKRERDAYLATYPDLLNRLEHSLNHIIVPPLKSTRYKQILIWGFSSTPEEAKAATSKEANPFNGELFDKVFAFGRANLLDLFRVSLDHLARDPSKLASQFSDLAGVYSDEVVCHSNGARIAEVLISAGLLKTKRLRILGGDGSLLDLEWLRKLQVQKNLEDKDNLKEISIYAIQYDIVPLIPVGWEVIDIMKKIGYPLKSYKDSDLTEQVLGLADRPRYNQESAFHVQFLTNPETRINNIKMNHIYESYRKCINSLRQNKYITSRGQMNPQCIISGNQD